MRTLKNGMNLYTLDEVMDETLGAKGTPEREAFEAYCEQELAKEQEKSHRITIPADLYKSLSIRAARAGQSVSSYVRHTLASVVL